MVLVTVLAIVVALKHAENVINSYIMCNKSNNVYGTIKMHQRWHHLRFQNKRKMEEKKMKKKHVNSTWLDSDKF